MNWTFLGGAVFGFLSAFCAACLIYLLTDVLDKANGDTFDGRGDDLPLVIDRKLAAHVVRLLGHDNRPAVEELVKQLKRALS